MDEGRNFCGGKGEMIPQLVELQKDQPTTDMQDIDDRFLQSYYKFVERAHWSFKDSRVDILGESDVPLLFIYQNNFFFGNEMRIYGDQGRQEELLNVKPRRGQFGTNLYDVTDVKTGKYIGSILYKSGFLKGYHWQITNAKGLPIATIRYAYHKLPAWERFIRLFGPDAFILEDMKGNGLAKMEKRQRFLVFRFTILNIFEPPQHTGFDPRLLIAGCALKFRQETDKDQASE